MVRMRILYAAMRLANHLLVHFSVCNYNPEYVDLLRYMVEKKMTICNHGAGHAHMTKLSDDQIREQIKQVNQYTMR